MTNKQAAAALRSAASALEHGRHKTAETKVRQVVADWGYALARHSVKLTTEDWDLEQDPRQASPDLQGALDSVYEQYVHDSKLPNAGEEER